MTLPFHSRSHNPFTADASGNAPSRRTVLRGFSALAPLSLLGHAVPGILEPVVERRSDVARDIFHVDDFGAKGDCNLDTGKGTDDTAAINATIRAAQAHGGGLVVFNPDKAYLLSDPFVRSVYTMGGPSIHLRPGVSLDGQGCTLYQSAAAVLIGNRPDYRGFATVIADIGAGSMTIPVDFPELFAPGDNVFLRLGDNGYMPIEPRIAMIATVRVVSEEGLTIDRPVPEWIEARKITLPNRRVYKLGELLDGISIRNFHFDAPDGGNPEAGFGVAIARGLKVENLWSHRDIGAGIVLAQFVEDSEFTRLVVMRNLNRGQHPSMGRALTFSTAMNCKVSHIIARDLAHSFCFIESHSKGIEIANAWIDYESNDEVQTVLFAAEESEVAYRNIHIRTHDRVNLHDSGGTPAAFSLRNITLEASAYPKSMPSVDHISGKLHLLFNGEKYVYDLENPRPVEKSISLKSGMYKNLVFPAGLVLSYETWLSPGTDASNIAGIYFGSASNNGLDIKADFTPGRWRKISALPGPGEDSNIYGNIQRLTEARKILVVTEDLGEDFAMAELRIRLHLAPHLPARAAG